MACCVCVRIWMHVCASVLSVRTAWDRHIIECSVFFFGSLVSLFSLLVVRTRVKTLYDYWSPSWDERMRFFFLSLHQVCTDQIFGVWQCARRKAKKRIDTHTILLQPNTIYCLGLVHVVCIGCFCVTIRAISFGHLIKYQRGSHLLVRNHSTAVMTIVVTLDAGKM